MFILFIQYRILISDFYQLKSRNNISFYFISDMI